MTDMTENNNLYEDNQIDIIALVKKVWLGRKLIIKVSILFFIIMVPSLFFLV